MNNSGVLVAGTLENSLTMVGPASMGSSTKRKVKPICRGERIPQVRAEKVAMKVPPPWRHRI